MNRVLRSYLDMNRFTGPRKKYLKIGVGLYEASLRGDWKTAKAIFDKYQHMRYDKYSITENGETALHVAASAKRRPKKVGHLQKLVDMMKKDNVEEFVKNLVDLMDKADLSLQNNNQNTALYLAAAAGNLKAVKIMVAEDRALLTIPGSGQMMPLYVAALFGNNEVVEYLYENSNNLCDEDGWTNLNRSWLLEKCVEGDMFDVALRIVKMHPELTSNGNVLRILARKPKAFSMKSSNIIWRSIIRVFAFIGLTKGAQEKESKALLLLRHIWEHIAKKTKKEIDDILRGPVDSMKQDNMWASRWVVQAMKLQKLIYDHITTMESEIKKITEVQPVLTNQGTVPNAGMVDQAMHLQDLIFKLLVNMHDETEKIIGGSPNLINHDDKPFSTKENQAQVLQKLIFKHISKLHDETLRIIKNPRKEIQAEELKNVMHTQIKTMRKEAQDATKGTYSSRVLFIAAETGNTIFLVELIRKYPDLIWKVNDNNQTIFHIAIKHRHEGIYNLLYELGAMKDLITPLRDPKENNMLHLVGKIAKKKQLEDVSGVALQMQRELLWFKEVKNMIPSTYTEKENEDGLTPHELFTKEHKNLVTLGEKWMKGTANQCMVVAALIATIVFAAAFTIPGGYNQDDGIPIFHSKATFIVFVVADAISLFSSSASILMFLSILTSRYAERDFLRSLPKKLMFGLLALFLSIATMTVAFSVSFFILYHKGLLWTPILIGVFGVMPVILYMFLQSGLFFDVFRSTYRSRYLFGPQKHILYYENPKV